MEQVNDIPKLISILSVIWFLGFFALVIIGFINNSKYLLNLKKLLYYLKINHPDIYKSYGEPKMLTFNPIKFLKTLKFIKTFLKEPIKLNDFQLQELKTTTAKLLKRGYILFGIAGIWFLTFPILFYIGIKLTG